MSTPNMLLTLPTVSVTTGPQWATLTNGNWSTVDAHDHSSGKGVRIGPAGININADLPFNSHSATNLTSALFVSQGGTLATLNAIYSSGGNLYWNNGSGTPVQITSGSALAASSFGGIGGLPSGSASVSFGSAIYSFYSATNNYAQMATGRVQIFDDTTATSPQAITLLMPSGGTSYTLTLPGAIPVATSLIQVTSGGIASYNSSIGPSLIKQATLSIGTSSGSFALTSSGPTNVTGCVVTGFVSTGRPIMIMLIADGTSSFANVSTNGTCQLFITTSGPVSGTAAYMSLVSGSGTTKVPPGAVSFMWLGAIGNAGTYTIGLQATAPFGSTLGVNNCTLLVYELY